MLEHFSIPLVTEPGRSNKHGKTLSLDHGHGLSMMELLYARHHAAQVMYRGVPSTVDTASSSSPREKLVALLKLHKACFQWTPVTGIATPEELGDCRAQWDPATLKSVEERQLEKQKAMLLQKKRKQGGGDGPAE